MSETDFAIIAGVERYDDPGVKPLKGAVGDARSFEEWVMDPNGGAVPKEHVFFLPDAPYEKVKDAFIELCLPAAESAWRGRRLYIYLSGHGVAQNFHEASLLTCDGGPRAPNLHVPGFSWMTWFCLSAYFQEVILFADCCRTAQREWGVQPFPLAEIRSQSSGAVRWVRGFGAAYGGVALEQQAAGGVFTAALIDALKHARRPDGRVTTGSVRERLLNDGDLVALRNLQQASLIGDDELVFSEGPPQLAKVRLRAPDGAAPAVEGGPGNERREMRRESPGVFCVELPRGIYAAKVAGQKTRFFEVTDVPGDLDVTGG